MTTLHLEYETSERGRGARQPLSEEKWCDYSDVVVSFKPTNLFLERESKTTWRNEEIETDKDVERGDTVYVVVVRYGDGDTFGHSTGNYSFWGAYKDIEQANILKSLIKEDDKYENDWEYKSMQRKNFNKYRNESKKREDEIKKLTTNKYASLYNWRGYFNSLEHIEIHPMVVI